MNNITTSDVNPQDVAATKLQCYKYNNCGTLIGRKAIKLKKPAMRHSLKSCLSGLFFFFNSFTNRHHCLCSLACKRTFFLRTFFLRTYKTMFLTYYWELLILNGNQHTGKSKSIPYHHRLDKYLHELKNLAVKGLG